MIVNLTKTTLPVLKIAIAWNDEDGFLAINKIIMLCKWMKLNFIFEPIEIAGQNYQKNMIYGIDESNLTRLNGADIFIHTKFDYSFFNEQQHINVEDYIDIAMENCIRTYFFDKDEVMKTTCFFEKNKKYIANIEDYQKINYDTNSIMQNYDFYKSVGATFAVFSLKKINDEAILNLVSQLLKFVGLNEMYTVFQQFLNKNLTIETVIDILKKQNFQSITYVDKDKVEFLSKIIYVDIKEEKTIPLLEETTTILDGKFIVKDLVSSIKDKDIKMRDELYLYQIIANGIEVYPNINFWEKTIFNPTIICKSKDENKITIFKQS